MWSLKKVLHQIFLRKSDPVYYCDMYKDLRCSHVDGFLCDFPECSMLKDYNNKKDNNNNE
jgi:hypothetical protein